MQLILQHGTPYESAIDRLRAAAQASGPQVVAVAVTHPALAEACVTLSIRLAAIRGAVPADGASAVAGASLAGFSNAHGAWSFAPSGPGLPPPVAGTVALPLDGSYTSLGWPAVLPNLSDSQLRDAVRLLAGWPGGSLPPMQGDALTRLSIATCEAVRLPAVAAGVGAVLGTEYTFVTPTRDIRGGTAPTLRTPGRIEHSL